MGQFDLNTIQGLRVSRVEWDRKAKMAKLSQLRCIRLWFNTCSQYVDQIYQREKNNRETETANAKDHRTTLNITLINAVIIKATDFQNKRLVRKTLNMTVKTLLHLTVFEIGFSWDGQKQQRNIFNYNWWLCYNGETILSVPIGPNWKL